ncbi:MAG TPA: tetratricopeptide repeat protein [Myxococcota bacterium]|jgi:tetratricopeptide (TPR) repeat protein|nr:tetratricopeptide repeat protein [Myxococcota bacterium]
MDRRAAAFAAALTVLTAALIALGERERRSEAPRAPSETPLALAVVTVPASGDNPLDRRIRALQARLRSATPRLLDVEQLGWGFVERARASSDAGDWRLALECARALEALGGARPEAWLLEGHALHALHRFEDAERVARQLAETRGLAFDHGLLGDVLLDLGRTEEAAAAYQRMMDLRPDAHAFARAAELRWITGDAEGAAEALRTAARAVSPRRAEAFAWIHARLATVELERGDPAAAAALAERALEAQPESAPAQLALGRAWLARGEPTRALPPLRGSAERDGTPEALWILAEAARAAGREQEAADAEQRLLAEGRARDPRGVARFLAVTGRDAALALALAEAEAARRSDPTTLSVLALAQARAGLGAQARETLERSRAAGTVDARLLYEAGLALELVGANPEARRFFRLARPLASALLPSERAALARRPLSGGA